MFVNIKAYDPAGTLIYEVNPYDAAAGTLKGLDYPYQPGMGLPDPQPLAANEVYVDELVYEMKPSSTDLTGEDQDLPLRPGDRPLQGQPHPAQGLSTSARRPRGCQCPSGTAWKMPATSRRRVRRRLRRGVTHHPGRRGLRGGQPLLPDHQPRVHRVPARRDQRHWQPDALQPDASGEPQAYIVQTDPFFGQLRAWGDTIWHLWTHNMNVDGAAPFLMASATTGTPTVCEVSAPTLNAATPAHTQVTLEWSLSGWRDRLQRLLRPGRKGPACC